MCSGERCKYLLGYRVKQVMNFTDVDDRTILGAQKAGVDLRTYTDQYVAAFREDSRALGLEEVEETPRATDPVNIQAMADMIAALDRNGHTYRSDGSVYFKISTQPGYGKLVHLDQDAVEARCARRHGFVRQRRRPRLCVVEGHEAR